MIYLAAPLFNPIEREFNTRLKNAIRYPVYLPQEDGLLLTDLLSRGVDTAEAIRTIFAADLVALNSSRMLVAILNGPHVDSGVAFEIGYFRSLSRPIIGFHTDARSELPIGFNPMIAGALEEVAAGEDELILAIEKLYPRAKV
jgi:nucleoside 2-deoxyribosyltransferase